MSDRPPPVVLALPPPWPPWWRSPPVPRHSSGRTSPAQPRAVHGDAPGSRGSHAADGRRHEGRRRLRPGIGDGRLVITAAKRYGARGVGIDIDPALITQSRANARKEGVDSLVEFRQQDAARRRRLAGQRGDALPAQRRQPEAAADAAEAAQAGLADRLAPVRHGRLGARPAPRPSPTSAARRGCSISGSSARHDGVRPRHRSSTPTRSRSPRCPSARRG